MMYLYIVFVYLYSYNRCSDIWIDILLFKHECLSCQVAVIFMWTMINQWIWVHNQIHPIGLIPCVRNATYLECNASRCVSHHQAIMNFW